ncbi:MAG TPA: ATP-binding protein [Chitinophagaceae bacterium]|nr:ATP-binding protein [Chitinophagaceae bacterium]
MSTPEIAIIFIFGTLTLIAFVFFLILIIIEYRKKHIRHTTEKLNLKHQYQSQVLLTKLEVQEQSFNYVSEEIHDNIAQTLSLVKMKLYQVANRTVDPATKQSLDNTSEILGGALHDLRNLSHILNGSLVSKLTLQESIEKELSYLRETNNMKALLTVAGSTFEPNSEKRLLIFRIVQESVSNAIKHGKANEINVSLTHKSGIFTVQIADNGKGFDTATIGKNTGLGLHNINIRAAMLGKLDIQSGKDKGTLITLTIETNEL